jgi:hypothetical protein
MRTLPLQRTEGHEVADHAIMLYIRVKIEMEMPANPDITGHGCIGRQQRTFANFDLVHFDMGRRPSGQETDSSVTAPGIKHPARSSICDRQANPTFARISRELSKCQTSRTVHGPSMFTIIDENDFLIVVQRCAHQRKDSSTAPTCTIHS